jgi:hypothetical protein
MFRTDLQCDVVRLAYDFATNVGALQMPPDNCCDMSGCIALFERIDADVTRIETMAGSKPDTIYRRTSEGWRADPPPP